MVESHIEISNSEELPQFFKIYFPAHCATQLKIPPAFIKYFEGSLPLKFILVTSARNSWDVNMNRVDDDVYFKGGWEEFVQDNELEFGDVLIFYYNGGSKFYVSIFGKNNCVKETGVANNVIEKQPTHIQGNETNGIGKLEACSVEDGCLSFDITIRPTYFSKGYLETGRVFYKYAKNHRRENAKLQHSGRTWNVKVVDCRQKTRFINGWRMFLEENCLAIGDVCTFKMINIKPKFYLFDVSFSRRV